MSREIIRTLHGMVPRRVINGVTKDTPAYIGFAAALVVDGVSVIVVANDQLDLSRFSKSVKLASPFNVKKTALVAMVHSGSVTLADTGFEPQVPVQADDYDQDDEL